MAVARVRHTDQFFLTVGPCDYYESICEDFTSFFEDLETYCVGIEKYKVNNKDHILAYLKFKSLYFLSEVRDCVSWFESSINVQPVRSRRNVLKYVSKEDEKVYFNCRIGELSFYYRSLDWARNTRSFRFMDPFVMEHPNYYRVLQDLHFEVHARHSCVQRVVPYVEKFYPGWGLEILLHLHQQLRRSTKQGLYVFGVSGSVRRLLFGPRWRHWDYPMFTCQCRGLSLWGHSQAVYMTVFYLKHLSLSCSIKTSVKLNSCWIDHISRLTGKIYRQLELQWPVL